MSEVLLLGSITEDSPAGRLCGSIIEGSPIGASTHAKMSWPLITIFANILKDNYFYFFYVDPLLSMVGNHALKVGNQSP